MGDTKTQEAETTVVRIETGSENVDWIGLFKDRVKWRTSANTVMNLQVPL
jgi:hypothetical protein